MNGFEKVFAWLLVINVVIGLGVLISNQGSSGNSKGAYTPSHSYTPPKSSHTPQPISPSTERYYHSSSSRSNYRDLWNECETYSAVLDENGVDHEGLSYPMDYHELEDLRDEYINLLEDNDIDY